MNKEVLFAPNRILNGRWKDHDAKIHKKKILEMRPVLDTSAPTACRYPIINTKRDQQEEERITQIEKQNRLLLEKMQNIMHGHTVYF